MQASTLVAAVPLLLAIGCAPLTPASHPASRKFAADADICSRQATAEALRDRGGEPGTSNEELLFALAVRERYASCIVRGAVDNSE
jgi:hypothetical protein